MMNKSTASDILSMRKSSQRWLSVNFHDEWVEAYAHYKCEREPYIDKETGKPDPEVTSLTMPDTWSVVRKKSARITANTPNLRVRAADKARAQKIGWKLMRDWDRGGVQRIQPRHVTQGMIFGWSVRPWTWAIEEFTRTKKVDPSTPDPDDQRLILDNYGDGIPPELMPGAPPAPQMGGLTQLGLMADMQAFEADKARRRSIYLLKEFGRKPGLIPVKYQHRAYEGPKSDFLFIGDCFPEPGFQTLRSSKWFIVQRYRDEAWMKRVAEKYPELKKGFQKLMDDEPYGTDCSTAEGNEEHDLRSQLEARTGRTNESDTESGYESKGDTRRWLILECHYPGPNARIQYASFKGTPIGEVPYPYELDGRIAFTELVLIDDILGGVGDSDARIMRGLQKLHDRAVCARVDLVDTIMRPLVWTTNQALYEDSENALRRGPGFRLIPPVAGPNEIGIIGEQAAASSVITSLQDTQDIQRLIQLATGESNLSAVTNNDPQQARTATGARILAYNQDVLTKQLTDALNVSLREDAEMMYLLNRSEMSSPVTFDAGPYNRSVDPSKRPTGYEQTETVTPLDFQADDDEIIPEAGSTLADDDEGKVARAQNIFGLALQSPHLFNQEKARDELLVALGKGRELAEWAPPPGPQEPPVEAPSLALSVSYEELPESAKLHVLLKSGLLPASMKQQYEQELAAESGQPDQPDMPPPPPSMSMPAPRPSGGQPNTDTPALNAALGGGPQ